MVRQWVWHIWDVPTMESDKDETSVVRQSPKNVEMTVIDVGDDDAQAVIPTVSGVDRSIRRWSFPSTESHHSSTVGQEPDTNWLDIPSVTITCSPATVTSPAIHLQTPSDWWMYSGAASTPGRVLPLTKYSKKLMSRDAAEASAAEATCVTSSITIDPLQPATTQWFPHTSQIPAFVPTTPNVLAFDFIKSLEVQPANVSYISLDPGFPAVISTSAVSGGSVKSPTVFAAAPSTLATMDVYDLGLAAECSSVYPSEGFQKARQEWSFLQRSDSSELESSRSDGSPHSQLPFFQLHVDDTSIFPESSSASSKPELEAASSCGSQVHEFEVGDSQSETTQKFESQLVPPMSSLNIAASNPAERRVRSNGSRGTRTHAGCSTLRYNRRHNPGLLQPRCYKCDIPGVYFSLFVKLP